jgi:dihydroflavonol-4-reductase
MKILVTGATGFVGSHAVAALAAAGHELRVLARTPSRVPAALDPFGVTPEIFEGDMTDPVAVAAAVAGCDAVVHAAAQIGVGGGDGGPAGEVNVEGVRTVIGAAIEAGVKRVVYTSSLTVHVPTDDPVITLDSPLANPLSPYGHSKVQCEELVRGWQADGHPVTALVLGGVYGPQSLELSNSFTAILSALEMMMVVPPSGTWVIDVRDVAEMIVRIVEADDPPLRVLAGGYYVEWEEWVATLEQVVGRDIPRLVMTGDELMAMALEIEASASSDDALPLNEEAATVMLSGVPTDERSSREALGIELRPLAESFADAVAYLQSIGRL